MSNRKLPLLVTIWMAAAALAAQVGCGKKSDDGAKSTRSEPAPKTEPVADTKVLALLFHSDT